MAGPTGRTLLVVRRRRAPAHRHGPGRRV